MYVWLWVNVEHCPASTTLMQQLHHLHPHIETPLHTTTITSQSHRVTCSKYVCACVCYKWRVTRNMIIQLNAFAMYNSLQLSSYLSDLCPCSWLFLYPHPYACIHTHVLWSILVCVYLKGNKIHEIEFKKIQVRRPFGYRDWYYILVSHHRGVFVSFFPRKDPRITEQN